MLEDVLLFNQPQTSDASRQVVDADLRRIVADTALVGSSRYVGRDVALGTGGADDKQAAAISLEVEDRPSGEWRVRISAAGLQRCAASGSSVLADGRAKSAAQLALCVGVSVLVLKTAV